jgi:hypothetical protein
LRAAESAKQLKDEFTKEHLLGFRQSPEPTGAAGILPQISALGPLPGVDAPPHWKTISTAYPAACEGPFGHHWITVPGNSSHQLSAP